MKTLLNAILKDEHRAMGLSISKDEDFIYLWQTNHRNPVAKFSAQGVAFTEIIKEADKYLVRDALKEVTVSGGIEIGRN